MHHGTDALKFAQIYMGTRLFPADPTLKIRCVLGAVFNLDGLNVLRWRKLQALVLLVLNRKKPFHCFMMESLQNIFEGGFGGQRGERGGFGNNTERSGFGDRKEGGGFGDRKGGGFGGNRGDSGGFGRKEGGFGSRGGEDTQDRGFR